MAKVEDRNGKNKDKEGVLTPGWRPKQASGDWRVRGAGKPPRSFPGWPPHQKPAIDRRLGLSK